MATLLASAPPSHAPLPQPGQVVAKRYELVSLIGRGGHGQIFSARHLGTGQTVALKILLPPADADEDFAIKRFFLEARATSGLSHPNTVRVFDFGQEDSGLVYLALELLTGQTLRQALRHRKNEGRVFTEREAIELALPITRSLAEAHAAKIVHRDLKPDNVFLHQVVGDEPVVKVLDFGIAKLGSNTLSTPTSVPGTPAYMSPEQVLGGDVDGRSDLYSLGVILFQLVTGELPFRGPSDPETLYMHAYQAPPDVRALAKTPLSDAFVRVIRRALEKDPTRRFADARELREALEVARDGARAAEPGGDATELVLPPRDTRPRDTRPRDGRHADVRPMTPALADDPTLTPLTTAKVPVRARAGAPSRGSVALIGAGAALALVLGDEARPGA
ncbi:serine/threonine protein kinase, partial [Myxococcota bacterium]|nr:serine/threonine protein kinase [Myxococcota bacterium]